MWDVGAVPAQSGAGSRGWTLTCTDGDPTCDADASPDGTCHVVARACLHRPFAGCSPDPVVRVRLGKAARALGVDAPATPADAPACANPATVALALRGRRHERPGKIRLGMSTHSASGKGRNDLIVRCVPPLRPPACPSRGSGQPARMFVSVGQSGSDLDLGSSGVFHGFPVPGGSPAPALLELCLDGCDGASDSHCTAASTSDEGEALGVPIPVLAAGVPVCLVTRYGARGVGGSLDLASGTASLIADVVSEVHLRLSLFTEVCPRCLSTTGAPGSHGRCSATAEVPGAACVVEAVGHGVQTASDQIYPLSSSCPPARGGNVAELGIQLPLTTDTTQLAGLLPCAGQQQDDSCGGGSCSDGICTGAACVALDAAGRCLDAKGGLSQACCSTNSAVPCFPTRGGGTLVRSGGPFQLAPPWGDPQYPKVAAGGALVGTFCVPASESSLIDTVAGLPGPGALVLPLGAVTVSD